MLPLDPLESYWNDFLINVGSITSAFMFVPVVTAFLYWKKLNKPLFIALLYFSLILIFNYFERLFIWATGEYYKELKPFLDYWIITDTIFLQILFYLNNFIILSIFFSAIFPLKSFKKYVFWVGIILGISASINFLFIEGYKELGIFNPSVNAVFVLILPLTYLWLSQKQSLRIPLKKSPYFWISLGILLPKIIGFFLYFSGHYFYKTDFVLYCKLYVAKNIFIIIGQILISIGFAHSYYARFIEIDP